MHKLDEEFCCEERLYFNPKGCLLVAPIYIILYSKSERWHMQYYVLYSDNMPFK